MTNLRKILEDTIVIHICTYCGGTGKMYKIGETINCDRCNGKGYEVETEEAKKQILALIPKRKEIPRGLYVGDPHKYDESNLITTGYNQAISEMEQSMTKED